MRSQSREQPMDCGASLKSGSHLISVSKASSPKESSNKVPFQWETSPGVPKESSPPVPRSEREPPPPRPPNPPPGPYWPRSMDGTSSRPLCHGRGSNGGSSDESLCIARDSARMSVLDGFEQRDSFSSEYIPGWSPALIIDRFLPAAGAMAAASNIIIRASRSSARRALIPTSSIHASDRRRRLLNWTAVAQRQHWAYQGTSTRPRNPSRKACGLTAFLPVRFKKAICGGCSKKTDSRAELPDGKCDTITAGIDVRGHYGSFMEGWAAPGWGLSFLESCELDKKQMGKGGEVKAGALMGVKDFGTVWGLPPINSPSESWLAHALPSSKKGNGKHFYNQFF